MSWPSPAKSQAGLTIATLIFRGIQIRGRVWDPLVRLFHWLLVAAFAIAWFQRSIPAVHETAGKVVLGLVIFRAFWGLAGPYSARFESFVRGPGETLRYLFSILRGRPAHHLGHNPAGAAMVGVLLFCLAGVSISGVLMVTTALWGNGWVEWAHGMFADACVVLIAGHLIGVLLASLQHREALPLAMITGNKVVDAGTPDCLGPPPDRVKPMILAVATVIASVVIWLGSVKVLDASFWRMTRLVAAQAAKAGCPDADVSGPIVEVWPTLRLRYDVLAGGRAH